MTTIEGALLRSVRAELALRRGHREHAEAGYRAVLAHWDRLGLRAYDAASLARLAEIAAARGDLAAARSFVDEGLAAVEAADTWVAVLGYARAALAVEASAARAGRAVDDARVVRLTALLDRGAPGAPTGSVAAAELATGRAELARIGDREDPDAWAAAVQAWSTLGFPWWRAASLVRRAEALVGRRGARDDAAVLVADVLTTADLLGADGLREEALGLARRAGLVLPDPAATGRPDAASGDRAVVDVTDRARSGAPGQGTPGQSSTAQGVPGQGAPRLDSRGQLVPGQRTAHEAGADDHPLGVLSVREREVVDLLSAGASNRRIAEQLFISEKTASVHVSHILAKLGVSSRLEAAAIAHRAAGGADEIMLRIPAIEGMGKR